MGFLFGERRYDDSKMSEAIFNQRNGIAGVSVSGDRALRASTVFACVRKYASLISTLPLDVYRDQPDGSKVAVAKPPIFVRPDVNMGLINWLDAVESSVELAGNAYALKIFDRNGQVAALPLLDPERVGVDKDGSYLVDRKPVDPARIWHVRGACLPGNQLGLSTLAYAREAIGISIAAKQYVSQFFSDGGHPSMIITADKKLSREQARAIKNNVLSTMRGNREPWIKGAGLTVDKWQVSPADAAFLEVTQATDGDICRFFDMPPEMIGVTVGGSSLTYVNRESRALDFLAYSIGPRIARLEEALSTLIPRGQYVKFNVDGLLRTDALTRMTLHEKGIRTGMYSVDDRRRIEDEAPLPNGLGEQYLWPPMTTTTAPSEAPQ